MPLQLLSRPTTDTTHSLSSSSFATPASKPQIPIICLTTATPCDANSADDASSVAPRTTSGASPVPIAPKASTNGGTSRKRLVPKKSKLSLLGSSSTAAKVHEKTPPEEVRRAEDASIDNASNRFEIYVDPVNDPEIGDILMVKKKKSRLGLDGLQWGMLGEVTNVPSLTKPKEKGKKKESSLKVKVDENQKWWSIGRNRKDSKEKDKGKDKDHAKSPQPIDEPTDRRARHTSLDSGMLLTGPVDVEHAKPPVEHSRIPTPPSVTMALPSAAGSGTGKHSVAIRAMRSVRSLARIGSWAQLKNTPNHDVVAAPAKDKGLDGKKTKKKKDREKDKDKAKETIRYSGSSFEAGTLSASPASKHESKSLGKKKASILGLGLPSTIRLPSSRSGSTASSIAANTVNNRFSLDSANLLGGGILARGRSGSTMSTTSSLRPMSAKSRESSGSSGAASVKWDEAGLRTVKEIRRKDRESRSKEEERKEKKKSKKSKSGRDSTRKSSDSRRTPLTAIFPGSEREEDAVEPATPIVTIHRATVDGHECALHATGDVNSLTQTPVKYVRPRPVSEQLLGRNRQRPFCEGDDDNVVMSLLDAATNDLAQLINRLDLEATPGSVEMTPSHLLDSSANPPPGNPLTAESPVKGLRRMNSSLASLRSYVQSCSKTVGAQLGQNIAPWSTLNAGISPSRPSPSTIRINFKENPATVRTHRRTLTGAPAADLSPVFKALRPATTRLPVSKTVVSASSGISPFVFNTIDRSPSTLTFGSGHSKSESRGSLSASPVFKKAQIVTRKRSSLAQHSGLDSDNLPILPEIRRSLGLRGTMGGSVGSIPERDHDGSDPDSDIPDELQAILSNSDQEGEDTISFKPKPSIPSPGLPPELPLPVLDSSSFRSSLAEVPVFRATVMDEDEHQVDVEEAGSEDDTKKSFDFTGELRRLNESGASDRRSFIEQLESAFRTPAKIDLRCNFEDLPPVPRIPTLQDELSQMGECSFNLPIDYESRDLSSKGFPMDVNAKPSLLPGSDSSATTTSDEELLNTIAPQVIPSMTSVAFRPSNGELNPDFKFGGKHSSSNKKTLPPLTLSDIIPPPDVARSLSMASFSDDECCLMKSILAHAIEIESPPDRPQPASDSTSEREARDLTCSFPGHQRNGSALSFEGFDLFAEVRRGFEFNDGRPGFYPPAGTVSDRQDHKRESMFSIASVSSYGNVLHGGSADPFDYGSVLPLPSLRERPSSDNFSLTMSTAVDDTFSFLRRQPARRRVDSDASSFYLRTSHIHPYGRSHRRESGLSVGPPISLFNRNSAHHRRGDSNTSISSIAQSHANCRRFSWARHRSNFSVESVLSDFSGTNLARPGLGDKMLDSALERGTPLASISVSPPTSVTSSMRGEQIHSEKYENRTSYDSVVDSRYESPKTDSLFEKTSRSSVCSSDSTFFEQDGDNAATKPPRYRPISSLSIPSVHSPPKEDDTMISMLGGGHVRRRSVTSMIGASPCIQVERRKNIVVNPPETVFSRIQKAHPEDDESPKISRVIGTKPSIASSTHSSTFGDERMIRAKHGLLERQSLENTVLIGDGEDLSGLFRMPVFTRPTRANRSRSSTCTSSSGAETPPLSISDGYSSFSEGSLSSIDLSHLNTLLSNTAPLSNATFDRARPHARDHRHRRRISQARASRTSIYETIQEELNLSLSTTSSPEHSITGSARNTVKLAEATSKTMDLPPVYVVDPETSSLDTLWDDEQGITALRRYYALRDEAEGTITESKRTWLDTPFSVFAVQSFDPPRHPSGMRAILEHSLQNYGPLPSELRLRRVRSRVNSRPSPYPRIVKTSFTSSPTAEHLQATVAASLDNVLPRQQSPLSNALQPIMTDANVPPPMSADKDCVVPPDKLEHIFGLPPRPRVASTTRRVWSKKSTGRNGVENKENNTTIGNISVKSPTVANVSQGTIMTSSDGLRLNRPRPKGRPTARPIRA